MAVDFLDWGSVEYSDVKIGRYPVMENGRRLFLIRNGEPEFPQEDFRKWFPVGAGFAGIGRLNTNTIAFEVGLHKALASADAHKFKAIVTLRIKIADQPAAWREAVMAHADLEPRIRSMVERVANETFAAHGYRDIYYAIPDVSKPFSLSLADRIESVSPYRLVSTGYEVEAIDASVDAAIKAAQREIALEAERERNEAIARDRVERERANELANFEHDDDLAKRRSKAKREEEAEAARLRI